VLPQQSSSASLVVTQGPGGSFEAMTSFLTEQQDKFVSLLREERETAEKQRRDSEAKLDEQQQQMEQQRQESEAKAERLRQETLRGIEQQRQETQQVRAIASAKSAVSEYQLELLQTRIDALHQAKLLTDDEIGALEDCMQTTSTAARRSTRQPMRSAWWPRK
jgi:hypothetical protein